MAAFYLHNTTRSVHTAGKRRQLTADQRSRKNLIIGGAVSVRRGRPLPVSEDLIRRNIGEISRLNANGLLLVTDGRGRRVDLSTLLPFGDPVPLSKAEESDESGPETESAPAPTASSPEGETKPEPEPTGGEAPPAEPPPPPAEEAPAAPEEEVKASTEPAPPAELETAPTEAPPAEPTAEPDAGPTTGQPEHTFSRKGRRNR